MSQGLRLSGRDWESILFDEIGLEICGVWHLQGPVPCCGDDDDDDDRSSSFLHFGRFIITMIIIRHLPQDIGSPDNRLTISTSSCRGNLACYYLDNFSNII